MKYNISTGFLVMIILLLPQCSENETMNHKDLDENMIDMMMYHDNLGLYLREGDADYSSWLLEGLDSSLKVISGKFVTHRKLRDPFEKNYKKKLLPPIEEIRMALKKNDLPSAISAYHTLTKNCNNCHIDHDIDKEVIDWSDPLIH